MKRSDDSEHGYDREPTDATLAVIDRALEAGAATATDPRERELEELALALRADAPAPDPSFAAQLDRRVEDGFPHDPRSPAGRTRIAVSRLRSSAASITRRIPGGGRRSSLALAGGVASVLVAVAIGLSLYQQLDMDGEQTDVSAPVTAPAEPDAGRDGGAGSRALSDAEEAIRSGEAIPSLPAPDERVRDIAPAPPFPGPPGEALGERDRRVQRAVRITLAAPGDELAQTAAGISETARRHGGFVLNSTLTTGQEGTRGGSFELRVPVNELDETLAELSDLGEVRSLTQDQQDVTASFESVEDRLRAARAERRGLLRRLQAAETDVEMQAIRRQLRRVNRMIATIRDDQHKLDRRTSFAAISVTLERGRGDADSATSQALRDARDILVGAMNIAIRAIAVLIPLSLLALLAWAVARYLRRRQREAALD